MASSDPEVRTEVEAARRNLEARGVLPEPSKGESIRRGASDKADSIKDSASGAADTVTSAAGTAADAVTSAVGGAAHSVRDAVPDKAQIRGAVHAVKRLAQESPGGLALSGLCLGFLAGVLAPTTAVDERLAPVAEGAIDKARDIGETALEEGKQRAQEAVSTAASAVTGRS